MRSIKEMDKRLDEREEEIERLNNDIKELLKENENKEKVILKYDNIINELENSIVGKINVLYQVRGQSNAIQELSILLRQLRELKGVDKE